MLQIIRVELSALSVAAGQLPVVATGSQGSPAQPDVEKAENLYLGLIWPRNVLEIPGYSLGFSKNFGDSQILQKNTLKQFGNT